MTTCTDAPVHLLCATFGDGECLVEPTPPPIFNGCWPSAACAQCGVGCVTRTIGGRYLHRGRCAMLYAAPKVEHTKPKGAFARLAPRRGKPMTDDYALRGEGR